MKGQGKTLGGILLGLAVAAGGSLALRRAPDPAELSAEARQAPARIDGAQARALAERGAILVDVRTPREYADGHVPGALNIPLDQLEARSAEIGSTDREVVVYCQSGRRSALAARKLQERGFARVFDLGPKSAW